MKIVIVETVLDGEIIGGGNLYLPGLIKGLVQKGNEVHLVLKGPPNPKISEFIENSGAIIHNKPWGKRRIVPDLVPIFANWVNELQPDVYFVSGSYDIGWLILPLLSSKIATFAIAHSNTENYYSPVRYYKNFISRAIGVSTEICERFETESGMPSARIQWIPYGIKPAILLKERRDVDVLRAIFAGRLEEYQKRISDIRKLVKMLATSGMKYHFEIIGDGAEYEPIKKELEDEIHKGNLKMPGWIAGENVLERFRDSDVFILTSDSEGFSISLIEAMANGCCPVVTDIPSGSIQLIENNINGFLVTVGDLDGFLERLTYLANNRDELLRMRNAAWETGKNYSIDRMVDAYIECFEKGIQFSKMQPRETVKDFPLMHSCRSKYPAWVRRIKLKLLNETGFSG